MTSAEFAAKYRVLKTLSENGAQSQIAQEVALGRMVMVHRLDVGAASDNQRLISQLASLDASAAEKVFGVWDVDGVQVVVTHFLASFTDFPSWLAEHANVHDAKTVVIAAQQLPIPPSQASNEPAPPPPPKPAEAGFTAVFGSIAPAAPVAVPPTKPAVPPIVPPASAPAQPAPANQPGDFTRVFQGLQPAKPSVPSVTPAVPAPAPIASPPIATPPIAQPPIAPPQASPSFTAVFGAGGSAPPKAADLPPALQSTLPPIAPAAARFDSVIPPVEPPKAQPVTPPLSAPTVNPKSNDFTSLFARLDPSATPSASQAPSAFSINPPAPPMAPPVVPPQIGAPPAVPSFAPPPAPPAGFGLPSNASPAAGPSEFTRVLGRVAAPNVASSQPQLQTPNASAPGIPTQAPQSAPAQPAQAPRPTKSYLPLIIALNVVLIVAIAVVVVFVVRK